MSQLIELEQQLTNVRNRMEAFLQNDGMHKNHPGYIELAEEEARILAQMDQQQNEENETIKEQYRSGDRPYVIIVAGEEINLRDYTTNEESYQYIASALGERDIEIDTLIRKIKADGNSRLELERQQHREQLKNADAAHDAKYNELYEQFHELKLAKEDFERRFQAATGEIESLKQQLEEATSKTEAPKTTNLNGNLAEARRKAEEAKPRIYNRRAGDNKTSFYLANLLETDEEITIPWTRIGQYREATEDEVNRFRQEREAAEQAAQDAMESTPDDSEVVGIAPSVEVPDLGQFQSQEDAAVHTDSIDGEMAENTIGSDSGETIEERVLELERKVEFIQRHLFSVDASEQSNDSVKGVA